MNALLALLAWLLGLFNPQAAMNQTPGIDPDSGISIEDTRDIHIMNANPRTVVALEDTHFRPNR